MAYTVWTKINPKSELILVSYDEYYNEAFNVGYTLEQFKPNWKNHLDVVGMWKIKKK